MRPLAFVVRSETYPLFFSGTNTPTYVSFQDLQLDPKLLKAVEKAGFTKPTKIQSEAIPVVLTGGDVMASAQTGTGKTAAFVLPILHRLQQKPAKKGGKGPRVLVLTPTRELATQINDDIAKFGRFCEIRGGSIVGGVGYGPQIKLLSRPFDLLVATPGRLMDHMDEGLVDFSRLEVLVLDEADRMLDMGFIHDIKKILALLPKQRQNLMFSATFSNDIRKLAKGLVNDPVEISVTPRNSTVKAVSQLVIPVDKSRKSALLTHLIQHNQWQQILVFCRTKHGANRLTKHLMARDIKAAAIHGNKSQAARTKALAEFKQNKITALVATDIAARGLDINQLPHVVNFDLPNVAEDYVHRIGRTGRAGAVGHAVSLVSADEIKQLNDIQNLIKQLISREFVDGFETDHNLPESRLSNKPAKAHKPKKNKPTAGANNRKPQPAGKKKPAKHWRARKASPSPR